jgi:hypothetical protein
MSTFMRDVRIQAFHEVGVKIDDALEAARLETARREGAYAAYVNSARNVIELIKSAAESNNTAAATEWVKKSAEVCENLALQAQALVHASRGAEKQTSALVALVKQLYDLEVAKKQRETEPVAPAGVVRSRTIKEERLAAASQQEPEKSAPALVSRAKKSKKVK